MFSGSVRVKSHLPGTVRSKSETRLLVKTKLENRPTNMNIQSGPGLVPIFFYVQSDPTGRMLIPNVMSYLSERYEFLE